MVEWRPVVGWEGLYEVSDGGDVRSLDRVVPHPTSGERRLRGRMLSPNWDGYEQRGYLYVTLSRQGERRNRHVHTLVLEAFVGPRPAHAEACHGPLGKTVNTPGNLRWDTKSSNMKDAVAEGTHNEARKKKCKRGHLLDGANLVPSSSVRRCRACDVGYKRAKVINNWTFEKLMQVEADTFYRTLGLD